MVNVIRNGRIIDPANSREEIADLYFDQEQILNSEAAAKLPIDRTIDASGLIVCPGLIDLNAKIGELNSKGRLTIYSEHRAALNGGITTVCIQPNTVPVIDEPSMAHMIRESVRQQESIRVVPLGALTMGLQSESLTNMASLKNAGCVGVSNARVPIHSTLLMRRAMQYAATFDLTVFIHSQDPWLTGNGCVHEGEMSTRLGLSAIPEAAETVAVARDLALVSTTGVRAHFNQLSCARSVDMIAESKARGLNISADVAVHNLHLTEFDIQGFNTLCHVMPPLRQESDMIGLREGVNNGTIQVICSDHQPCSKDDKLAPFIQTVPGISGLETLLPLTLKLVDDAGLSLQQAIACLTCNPAKTLGLNLGTLSEGAPADICIFDPNKSWEFDPDEMLSNGKNNPFGGMQMRGRVAHTIIGGVVATDLI